MNNLIVPVNMQPQQQMPQMQAPPRGNIDFAVARPGQEGTSLIDEQVVMADLRNMGYQPRSISPDGLSISLDDGKGGLIEASVPDVITKMGYQVHGIVPQNVNHDRVDLGLRTAISAPFMDDDDSKRAFLEVKLRKMGMEGAKLTGSGMDWHVFDPTQNQWFALTNKPGMDMSDAGQVLGEGPRLAGSIAGGATGFGGAGPLGLAAGSAVGGQLGDMAASGIGMMMDEDYRNAVDSRSAGQMFKEQAPKAAVDALAGGVGGLVSKFAPALFKGGAAATAARTGGRVAEETGNVAAKAGGYLREAGEAGRAGTATFGQEMASQVAAQPIFGMGSVVGDVMQAPSQAIHGLAKGMGHLGESEFMQNSLPGLAKWMRNAYSKYGAGATRGGDVIKNFSAERAAQRGMGLADDAIKFGDEGHYVNVHGNNAYDDAYKAATNEGLGTREAIDFGGDALKKAREKASEEIRQRFANTARAEAQEAPNAWASGLNAMEDFGKTVNKGMYGVTGAMGSAAETGGRVLRSGGKGFRYLGESLGKYETPAEIRLGAEEAYRRMRSKRRALQAQAAGTRMNSDPTLASTY